MICCRSIYRVFLCCCVATAAYARTGVSVGYGEGTKSVQGYRLNIQREWSNVAETSNKRQVSGYCEFAYTRVENKHIFAVPTNRLAQIYSGSIVLRIPMRFGLDCYADIGIGAAFTTPRYIATRDLGARWVFEDRLGCGILLGRQKSVEIGYRLVHFSNAYLAQKNQGLNLHLLILGYWFS